MILTDGDSEGQANTRGRTRSILEYGSVEWDEETDKTVKEKMRHDGMQDRESLMTLDLKTVKCDYTVTRWASPYYSTTSRTD